MSGLLTGIKKVFKKVGKVLKKIALPALAIGAVVLTGGAALGVLPSIGALGSSIGLSSGLTGILATAAKSATIGAVGSALTGGDPIKGATAGFLTGGLVGAVSGLGASQVAKTGVAAATNATTAAPGGTPVNLPATGTTIELPNTDPAAVATKAPAAVSGLGAAQVQGQPVTATGGNPLSFLERNPILAGSLIQGIGGGLMAGAQAKAERKAYERDQANYGDTSQLFRSSPTPQGSQPAGDDGDDQLVETPLPYANSKFLYDKKTGRVRLVQGA
jgi:hypothetical protein